MKKDDVSFFVILVIGVLYTLFFVGPQLSEADHSEVISTYNGRDLSIAVVGRQPGFTNPKVTFTPMEITSMTIESVQEYDAVFICEDMLEEASHREYSPVYLKSKIPFFFIGTTKTYVPFTDPDLTYEDAKELEGWPYIEAIVSLDEDHQYLWQFDSNQSVDDRDPLSVCADDILNKLNQYLTDKERGIVNSPSKK